MCLQHDYQCLVLVHDKLALVELACTDPSIKPLETGEVRDTFGPCRHRHPNTELGQATFMRLVDVDFVM